MNVTRSSAGSGERRSPLAPLVDAAHLYSLGRADPQEIVDRVVAVIRAEWSDAADRARLTQADRTLLWESQILNPSIFCALAERPSPGRSLARRELPRRQQRFSRRCRLKVHLGGWWLWHAKGGSVSGQTIAPTG